MDRSVRGVWASIRSRDPPQRSKELAHGGDMRQMTRWVGAGLVSLAGMGCVAANFPGQPSAGELARDMIADDMPRLARMQRPEDRPIQLAQATVPPQTSLPTQSMPPLN